MDEVSEVVSRLLYACREGYYNYMQSIAIEGLRRFQNDSVFKFYHSISLLFQKKVNDAIRGFEELQNEPATSLASSVALIAAHRMCSKVDKEAVASLEVKIRESRKSAKWEALYYTGMFLYLNGKPEKAKEYLDRAVQQTPENNDVLCARGWTEIKLSPKDKGQKDALFYFETVLKSDRRNLEALLGICSYKTLCHQFEVGMERMSQILSFIPNWIPALMEKMNLYLCLQDWDQAIDRAKSILTYEDRNLEAHRLKILYALCREGDMDTVNRLLEQFFGLCKKYEPYNAAYFIENARMFSQLASFENRVLEHAMKFAVFATDLDKEKAEYVADIGRIYLLMGKTKEAYQEFRAASNIDSASASALYGMISCRLAEGNVDTAAEQLTFFRQVENTVEAPAELSYLTALIAKQKNEPAEMILKHLNEALDNHFGKMRGFAFNVQYLKAINPSLVLNIVKELLLFAPQEPTPPGMQIPTALRQASLILEKVTKVCPCQRDAMFIGAQIAYLSGEFRSAMGTLNQILNIDSSFPEARLLLAHVQISQNEFVLARQTLDNALASNFQIREHPKYHLLLAKVQKNSGECEKARKTLETALNILKVSNVRLPDSQNTPTDFGSGDKMSLYMDLVEVLRALNKPEEAAQIMQTAFQEFKGTHLEGKMSLSQAEEMIAKGDIDKALHSLRAVQPSQNHYMESRKLMGEIYLNIRFNTELFIACFVDITKHDPSPHNLILLADAYMTIQEPDKAIEIYEVALAKNPRDSTLACKMGQALVLTHQFAKAVNYYKEAVKYDDNFMLRFDLATLHVKLKQWDKAERAVNQALSDIKDSTLTGLLTEVKLLVLLGRIQQGSGNATLGQMTLLRAQESQGRALKRAMLEMPSILQEQKIQFCMICRLLGDVAEKQSDVEKASRSLKEALEHCPDDWQCLVTLARLYMKAGDHVQCQQICQQLLKIKSDCPDASVMLGELFFRKFDFQSSAFHFQQFLDSHPLHWKSLQWFVECSRRSGTLLDADPYLKAAINVADPNDPGLGYCQGLYEWYSGNANTALRLLNKARKDSLFGQSALLVMIDIYVNPTGGVLGGDAMDGKDSNMANGSGDRGDFRELSLSTAETLIKELSGKTSLEKFKKHILECFVLLASKNKGKVEKAVQELSGLVTTESGRDSVMLVYALATGYMFMKQTPRARNQLKRIVKSNWTVEEAEYLERCWLLLADIYIQSSKFDLATDLIKKVLHYNKSSMKANEYLGFIMEKEQAYADAAINYEQAWKLTNSSNPALGFKLAFNYLKAKRYTDAIDVCHIVMGKHPTYPRIKKEILDKARASLRM